MAPVSVTRYTFRTIVKSAVIIAALLLLALYIFWQARFLIAGPRVSLAFEPPRVSNDRRIWLEGTATNITSLSLNGRQIFTDPHGNFREALILENGYTIATIAATDRYGRETKLERPFMYMPASLVTNN
jgi:hypothetical protein